MSRRSRSRRIRATNWVGPIVIAVVMGGIAYTVSDSGRSLFGTEPAVAPTSTFSLIPTTPVSSTRFQVAVRNAEGDRDLRFSVDPVSGQIAPVEVPKGWRVEALNDTSGGLHIESSEVRGFKLTDGTEWNVALRSINGEAYTEPRLLGKLDDKHAIVVGRTDRMRILNVSRAGQVTALADVPENTNVFGLSGGAVWMATFNPGEGLESEPSGPSTLYKVTPNGEKEIVDSTKTADFFNGVLSDGVKTAVWLNTGSFTADGDGRVFNGVGLPLAWLDGKLLVAEGKTLFFYDGQGQKQKVGVELPGEPITASPIE
ncbi:hypothetical protein IT087_02535 [Candidatus Uhrbacteria bacterium]|nr:hypothetical protein [Candidatus Uhrbacteria bacterium]